MSSYPKQFSYYISRVNNFSRQKIRLATIANTTFNPNDTCVIELPQGLLDLSTFTLQFRLNSADGASSGQYLPFAEGMVDSVSIECGGVSIQSGFTNYNDLFNIFRQYQMADKYSFRRVLQNELTQPVGGTASNYALSNAPTAIWNWLGFLGSVDVLDTTILPPIKVYIRLASPQVNTVHAGNGGTRTFRWSSVVGSIDVMDISDGILYSMVAQRLQQAPLEIPFTNFQTVVGGFGAVSQSTRWSTSTDCLEAVIGTLKGVNYDSNNANSNTQLSSYFTRGGGDSGTTQILNSQYSVNGVRYPANPAVNADGEVFTQTAHAFNVAQDTVSQVDPAMTSLPLWSSNFWVHANSFTYPDPSDSHKLIGLSGRGNQILGTFETTGSGSNVLPIIFLRSKSVLRVGSGKMVELVL
jgi:hypothetical protein